MSSGHVEPFRTHGNYIHPFAMLCDAPYATGRASPFVRLPRALTALASSAAAAPSMSPPPNAQPDLAQARRSLTNAWGTELLLAFGGTIDVDEPLMALMNNWAVVQTYYTAYHAAQALIVARGQRRPESHPKTQAQFATLWSDRPLQLPPWSLGACDGGWQNPPVRGIDDSLNSWSGCDPVSCWNLAAKALRTTRGEKIADAVNRERARARTARKRAWNAEDGQRVQAGRKPRIEPHFSLPRLSQADRDRVEAGVRTHTILDYLYRLRVKTNYEDAGMFIDGPEDEQASRQVHRDLITIASCTMLVHELHIGAAIGQTELLGWVDHWLARHRAGADVGVSLRRDLLAAHP